MTLKCDGLVVAVAALSSVRRLDLLHKSGALLLRPEQQSRGCRDDTVECAGLLVLRLNLESASKAFSILSSMSMQCGLSFETT